MLQAMREKILSTACLVSILALSAVPAWSEGFPGKGNPGDWSDALPYYNLANKYMSKERYEDAIQKYQEAIARYPYDADFFTNLGVAYRKMDDYGSAEIAYKKALDLNNNDWSAWSNLANSYLKQDRLKDTIAAFERSLKCHPPVGEQNAMLQDINDIKKILRVRGELPLETTAQAKGTPVKRGVAHVKSKQQLAAKPATEHRSDVAPAAPARVSEPNKAPHGLGQSGWDYIYR